MTKAKRNLLIGAAIGVGGVILAKWILRRAEERLARMAAGESLADRHARRRPSPKPSGRFTCC